MNIKLKFIVSALLILTFNAYGKTNNISDLKENKALEIPTPDDEKRIQLLRRVAAIYYQNKELDSSKQSYKKILSIIPYDDESTYMLGIIYINQKNYEAAINLIEKRIKINPKDFQAYNNLAWLYATAEDLKFRNAEKSLDYAQKALVLSPYDKHIWSTLAESYFVCGNFEKAKRAMLHLVKMGTENNEKFTQEMISTYNNQIQKFDRAIKTKELIKDANKN